MKYFILYNVDDPHALAYGLRIEEFAESAAAMARAADLAAMRGVSGVRVIRGVELAVGQGPGPLVAVKLAP